MPSRDTFLTKSVAFNTLPSHAYFKAHRIPAGNLVETHHHDCDQFMFARAGVMHVTLRDSTLVVPPQYGMWIPAGTKHSVSNSENVDLETLYLKAGEVAMSEYGCKVVVVSLLVREFIHYACQTIGATCEAHDEAGMKVKVLLSLIKELPEAPFNIPFPKDEKLIAMCDAIQAEPELEHTLFDWASRLNASTRTLARHFLKETGMTFHAWKQRLKLLLSLSPLQNGESVTEIALSLGYCSTSAYIHAFKTLFGCSPGQFYLRKDS